MRKHSRLWLMLGALLAFALVAAACGDDDEPEAAPATTAAPDADADADDDMDDMDDADHMDDMDDADDMDDMVDADDMDDMVDDMDPMDDDMSLAGRGGPATRLMRSWPSSMRCSTARRAASRLSIVIDEAPLSRSPTATTGRSKNASAESPSTLTKVSMRTRPSTRRQKERASLRKRSRSPGEVIIDTSTS